ncbi:hypothetical protein WJX81_000580 [Elliptochloris bilobata]|uniref:CCD97-like C-terminal domain-containing protein n=1 Tax=Elliptochloris bilobata TaxID=381761 RepID=A0AAW1SCW4_9CHLO
MQGGSAGVPGQDKIRQYLTNLLERDSGVFLERYGSKLSSDERGLFQALRDHDYEVNFHLSSLEAAEERRRAPPGKRASLSAQTRNRRWAALQRLEQGGEYFTEEAMRRRAPLLFQQYLGDHQPVQTSAAGSAGGGKLSDLLLRQHDEALTRQRLITEQAREAEVEQETDSEEEEEHIEGASAGASEDMRQASDTTPARETSAAQPSGASDVEPQPAAGPRAAARAAATGTSAGQHPGKGNTGVAGAELRSSGGITFGDGDGGGGDAAAAASAGGRASSSVAAAGVHQGAAGGGGGGAGARASGAEQGGRAVRAESADREDFLELMRARFLSGQDDVDYGKIDADGTLDEDLRDLAEQDAEDKYFDSD